LQRPDGAVSVDGDAELLDQWLAYIERRRLDAQRRFVDLARRRAAMSPTERGLARDALRAEAAELRNELVRLNLAASVTRALLRPPSSRPRATPARRRERILAYHLARPNIPSGSIGQGENGDEPLHRAL
jgi:Arc/MetJ family transcription regulator